MVELCVQVFFLVEAMGQLDQGRAGHAGYLLVSVVGKVMVSEGGHKQVSGASKLVSGAGEQVSGAGNKLVSEVSYVRLVKSWISRVYCVHNLFLVGDNKLYKYHHSTKLYQKIS